MITINVTGRLVAQPELKTLPSGGMVCEFRLCDARRVKNRTTGDWEDFLEFATFFCYGEEAEDFASKTVKGQEIEAAGVQESSVHKTPEGNRTYVKYKLIWHRKGRKPNAMRNTGQSGQEHGEAHGNSQHDGYSAEPRSMRQSATPRALPDSALVNM